MTMNYHGSLLYSMVVHGHLTIIFAWVGVAFFISLNCILIKTLDLKSMNCNIEGLFVSLGTVGDKWEDVKQNDSKLPSYLSLSGIYQ